MEQLSKIIQQVADGIDKDALGIPTGYPELDEETLGLEKQELTLIAASSSLGKSAFMLDLALNTSEKNNVGIFSLEMSLKTTVRRIIGNRMRVKVNDLRRGRVKISQQVIDENKKLNLWINELSGLSALDIWKIIKESKVKFDIIFVDYLQLVKSMQRGGARYEEVDALCKSLRDIGKSENIAMVLLCQLNREVINREGHRPRVSDLRESGGIEQTADKIWLLHRPMYYKRYVEGNKTVLPDEDDSKAFVIIAKNRNGPLSDVEVMWDGQSMSFKPCIWKMESF